MNIARESQILSSRYWGLIGFDVEAPYTHDDVLIVARAYPGSCMDR